MELLAAVASVFVLVVGLTLLVGAVLAAGDSDLGGYEP